MPSWDEVDFSTVKTGDIKKAEITINKYRVEDGQVKEEEENVPITDEELDEIKREVGDKVQDALDEFDQSGDVTTMDVDLGDETASPSEAESAAQSASSQSATTTSSEQDSGTEQSEAEMDEALSVGRTVAAEEGITKNDYADFAGAMRSEGYTDQSFISDVWGELRDDGTIGRFPPDGGDTGTEDGEQQEETEESESNEESADTPEAIGRQVAEEQDIAPTDYPTFAKEMRDRDITEQDTISDVWQTLRDDGTIGEPDGGSSDDSPSGSADSGGETQHPSGMDQDEFGIPAGTDILMVQTDEQASDMVVSTLHEPIDNEEVVAIPITSDIGEAVLEPMEEDVTTPFYLEATEEGLVQHPLEMLIEKYE